MHTLTTFIQHNIGSPSHSNQMNKRNKMYPNFKRGGKIVTVCSRHDTIYRKPLALHTKTTQLINEFYKVSGYKINIQKLVVFLYTNNEILEKECKTTIAFKITPPKNSNSNTWE